MKNLLILRFAIYLLLSHALSISAQAQQVVTPAGGHGQKGDTLMEWTLGEMVVSTLITGDAILTQGFHQPLLTVTTLESYACRDIKITVCPNPAYDRLLIQSAPSDIGDLQYVLYDLKGKLLGHERLTGDVTPVSMEHYPAGLYLLRILWQDRPIETFEIIKH
jgi:hypothetical protein